MFDTLYLARANLFSLGIVAFVIIAMLAMMGNLTLGPVHSGLASFSGAFEVISLFFFYGDLAGINSAVKARGVDQTPLMSFAGQLFFAATWFFLSAVLLNFLFGILIMSFYEARFTKRENGPERDVLEDLRAMLGPTRRRKRLVKLLQDMRLPVPSRSAETLKKQEEMILMRIRGIWLQGELLQQGAIENAFASTADTMAGRLQAAAIAGFISDKLGTEVKISGTALQLRHTRIMHQARSLAVAVKTVKEIRQAVQRSLMDLEAASDQLMLMWSSLERVSRQPEHLLRGPYSFVSVDQSESVGSHSGLFLPGDYESSWLSSRTVSSSALAGETEMMAEGVLPSDASLSMPGSAHGEGPSAEELRHSKYQPAHLESDRKSRTTSPKALGNNKTMDTEGNSAAQSGDAFDTSMMVSLDDESLRAMLVYPAELPDDNTGMGTDTSSLMASAHRSIKNKDEAMMSNGSVRELSTESDRSHQELLHLPGMMAADVRTSSVGDKAGFDLHERKQADQLPSADGAHAIDGRLHRPTAPKTAPSHTRNAEQPKKIEKPFL